MQLRAQTITTPLRAPFRAGHGTVSDRTLVLVSLQAGDGARGHGEAAPLPSYDGVSIDDVLAALDACAPVLESYPGHAPVADVISRCAEQTTVSPALAAIDLALWDLTARRAHQPLWRLLGARRPLPIEVNATIAAGDRSGAAAEAAQARVAGFRTVKVKVAIGDDAGRLAAVRAFAGPRMAIRIDANGAWEPWEAEANLAALAPVELELCEEPVHGLGEIEALRSLTEVPLALDESAALPGALDRPVADVVCLKIARCGGISATLAACGRARAAGYRVYLASTLDGPLGIAAALHCAAVIAPEHACGLATLSLFHGRGPDPLAPRDGTIALPEGPGLGDGLVEWYGSEV